MSYNIKNKGPYSKPIKSKTLTQTHSLKPTEN